MKTRNILLIVFAAAWIFSSCGGSEGETDLQINLNAKFENQDLVLQQAVNDPLGNQLRYTVFKFYLSDIVLVKDDNTKFEISDIELVDFNTGSTFSIEADIEEGSYKALEFGLGVSPDLNAQDPSMFANDHPLSSFTNTFWTWTSKYRFALIEGDIDTSGNGSFPLSFIYHTGLDTLYTLKSMPLSLNATGGSVTIDLNVQADEIFFSTGKEVDYINESATHTMDNLSLAARVMENLFAAIQ
ncbi:MAG: hypothetical protein HKN92_02870 [Chitinophagales bacterium]|nr:hypothetical protein [Chitinophagales bacterium]